MRKMTSSGFLALATLVVRPDAAAAQDRMGGDGFHIGARAGIAAIALSDDIDRMLNDPSMKPAAAFGVHLGYARGPIDFTLGVELSEIPLEADDEMGVLGVPFELRWRPSMRLGPVAPGVVIGYVRYGAGATDVDAADIPPEVFPTTDDQRVSFLGNAFRGGVVLEGAFTPGFTYEVRPSVDLIWFDTVTIHDEGDVSLRNQEASVRPSLTIGAAYTF